jgi:hypothetical protein
MKTNTALVLIGIQELRREKKSDYCLRNMEPLIERASYLVQYAREMGYKIIFIQHYEKEGPFSLENELSNFVEELFVQEEDIVIRKQKISAFL